MRIRHGEIIALVVKRHKTPFVFKLIKIIAVAAPLYIVIFMISGETSGGWILGLLALLSFFVGIVIAMVSLDYLLDKLVITNKRVVWINWKSLFKREEHEMELLDIQDIETREKGLLSELKIFDYGFIEIESAASSACISFPDCPNPGATKNFILGQMEKQRGGIHEKWEPPAPQDEWSVN